MENFENELLAFTDRMQTVYGVNTNVSIEENQDLQRTEKWRKDRAGNFTGSKFGDLMACSMRATKNNPKDWRVKAWLTSFGDTAFSYIISRAIERATGEPMREVKSPYMDWGNEREDEGKEYIESALGIRISEVGFIKFAPNAGASADGKTFYKGYSMAFELKCPATQLKHYKHMNTDITEKHEYFWQFQAEMLALKVRKTLFGTFDPSFPTTSRSATKTTDISPIHCRAMLVRTIIGEHLINTLVNSNFQCDLQKELDAFCADIPESYLQIKKWLKMNEVFFNIMWFFVKKYYWYQVEYSYRDKPNGNIIAKWKTQIGLIHKNSILNSRELKKVQNPLHKDKFLKKHLCNGVFTCEVICYLGKFKSIKK